MKQARKVEFDDVLDALERRGPVKAVSHYYLAHCPWHDDRDRSLLVFPDGWWKCMGECGKWGRNEYLYDELMSPGSVRLAFFSGEQLRGDTPNIPTSLYELEEYAWDCHHRLLQDDTLLWPLQLRGVDGRVERCELGWDAGWITVPIFDETHEIMGLVARSGPAVQEMTGARFDQPAGQKPMMYCPDWTLVRKADRPLAVVFGIYDALALSDLRFPVVSPIAGKNSFEPEWLDSWQNRIVIIPDEGEEADANKLAGQLGWRAQVYHLPYDEQVQDPADFVKSAVGRREELNRLLGGVL